LVIIGVAKRSFAPLTLTLSPEGEEEKVKGLSPEGKGYERDNSP